MVRLESQIRRFIGTSYDVKPTIGLQAADAYNEDVLTRTGRDLPNGSTFFEEDTGDIWRWNGTAWTLPEIEKNLDGLILQELKALRTELVALRLGMIEAGECREVPQADYELATAY